MPRDARRRGARARPRIGGPPVDRHRAPTSARASRRRRAWPRPNAPTSTAPLHHSSRAAASQALAAAASSPEAAGGKGHIGLHSAMLLLKGFVYESLENWPLAARHYCGALRAEPLNFEALHRLVTNHMLTAGEQTALLAGPPTPST